jgi:tryptophan-rich sensory protein
LSKLDKPGFTPPAWVFGPAWTLLYVLLGISAWLVWRQRLQNSDVKMALLAYFVQLGLNFLWSPFFFGLRSPVLALIDILLLLIAILWMLSRFSRISLTATALTVPYFLWVAFAAALNFAIVRLN